MLNLPLVEAAIARASLRSDLSETHLLLWLRREFPPEIASQAVLQIRLRNRAKHKFSHAERMWFTPEGLEQSSAEPLASYHASRFPQGELVVDAGCGIGGDLIALAGRGPAAGVERDALSVRFASLNLRAYAVEANAVLIHGDLLRLRMQKTSFLFIDPARRGEGRRWSSPEQWQPDWNTACRLASAVRGALVKTAPALPPERVPPECEREYISADGECREMLLAFGECRQGIALSALILPRMARLSASGAPPPTASLPLAWIYDPDPAVVAAGLLPDLAQGLGASLLHPRIAYLTAEHFLPTPFARAYRVVEYFPYSRRQLLNRLRALGAGVITVKKRGIRQLPEDLVREWKPTGTRAITVLLYRSDTGVVAVLAQDA